LYSNFTERPNKFVTAVGELTTKIYKDNVDCTIFADNFGGLNFADCVERDEAGGMVPAAQARTPSPVSPMGEDDVPF
jgi:hypothetical protein